MSEGEFWERMKQEKIADSKMEEDIISKIHKKLQKLSTAYMSLMQYTKDWEQA